MGTALSGKQGGVSSIHPRPGPRKNVFDALPLDGGYIDDDGSFIRTHAFLLKFIFVFLWNRGQFSTSLLQSQ